MYNIRNIDSAKALAISTINMIGIAFNNGINRLRAAYSVWLAITAVFPLILSAQPDKDHEKEAEKTKAEATLEGTSLAGSKQMLHSLGLRPKSVIYYYLEDLDLPKLDVSLQAEISKLGGYKVIQTINENQVFIEALPHSTRDTIKELVRFKKQALYLIMVPASELKKFEDWVETGTWKMVSKTISIADDALINFNSENQANESDLPDDEHLEKMELLKVELAQKGIDVTKDWAVLTLRASGNLQEKIVLRPDEYYVKPELKHKGFRQLGQGGSVTLAFMAGLGIGAGIIYFFMKNR